MTITIYHNPRCSKSRQTLQLLQAAGRQPVVIEYLKTPPTVDELAGILKLLGMKPRELIRDREEKYIELGLNTSGLDDTRLIEIMVANPVLIERPIVIVDGRAAIGRPPEAVLDII